MNSVCIIGNLAANPELRATAGGTNVCNFRLAVNRPTSGKTADFFDVICFDKIADNVDEYLNKGRKVAVEGRLQLNQWETKEGEKRSRVEIVAHRVHFLNQPTDAGASPKEPSAAATDDFVPVGS